MRGKQDHSRERRLRHDQTLAESRLWQHLRNRALIGHKFRRQHRIGAYYVDFVCTEAWLVVELDGSQHLARAGYDAARSAYLRMRGYRVLRFWNDEALQRIDQVLEAILAALRTPHPGSLREPVPLPAARGEGNDPAARAEGKDAAARARGNDAAARLQFPSPRLRGEGARRADEGPL